MQDVYKRQFQNSEKNPLVYGDVEIHNIPRRRLRGEEEKEGIIAESVFVGFCGTDYTLMNMGREGNLKQKFPEGCNRLINGHEGVVWVPDENRFAIVPVSYTHLDVYKRQRMQYIGKQKPNLMREKKRAALLWRWNLPEFRQSATFMDWSYIIFLLPGMY